MPEIIEHTQIDLRYQKFRLQNQDTEKRLFVSIESNGIQVPLAAIKEQSSCSIILLDGFKRYRCAGKLGIHQLPVSFIGTTEVEGLFRIIRHNDNSSLSAFEQACFIEQLHTNYTLSFSEIARRIDRSVAWVSVRIEMLKSISDSIREKIISGAFPLRSYMYDIAPFTRVKGCKEKIEHFVEKVSGHKYSTRDIATLSQAFFKGDGTVEKQILDGNVDWTLRMLKDRKNTSDTEQSPEAALLQQQRICQWHITALIKTIKEHTDLLSNVLIQTALHQLQKKCEYLVTISK